MGSGNMLTEMLNSILNNNTNTTASAAALEQFCNAGNVGSDSAATTAFMANLMGTDSLEKFNLMFNNKTNEEKQETPNDPENKDDISLKNNLFKLLTGNGGAIKSNEWKNVINYF